MDENQRIELLCEIAGAPFSILGLLWVRQCPMSASEVAQVFAWDRHVVGRALATLLDKKLVEKTNSRAWAVSPAMLGQLMLFPNGDLITTQRANGDLITTQPLEARRSLEANNNNNAREKLFSYLKSLGVSTKRFAETGRIISVGDAQREFVLFNQELNAKQHDGHIRLLRWRFNEIADGRRDPPAATIERIAVSQTHTHSVNLNFEDVKKALQTSMRFSEYVTWVKCTELVKDDGDELMVRCANPYAAEYCNARVRLPMQRAVSRVCKRDVTIRFVSDVEVSA